MQTWIIIVLIIAVIFLAIILRVVYEMHHPKISEYNISSDKLNKGQTHRLVYLSDLHSRTYGKKNIDLIEMIKRIEPDYILLGGDMIIASPEKTDDVFVDLLENLSKTAPVFYAPGNHEKDLAVEPEEFGNRYGNLVDVCNRLGVRYLENEKEDLPCGVSVFGLDIDFKYYKRIKPPHVTEEYLTKILPAVDRERYNILLAHNPKNFNTYEKTGVDLVLSGHFHGGVIRLPFGRGLITPRLLVNSNYTWGSFIKNNTRMIVSSGIGTHSVNIRLFNRPEVVVINLTND